MGYPKGRKRCGATYSKYVEYKVDEVVVSDGVVAAKCRKARPCAVHDVGKDDGDGDGTTVDEGGGTETN